MEGYQPKQKIIISSLQKMLVKNTTLAEKFEMTLLELIKAIKIDFTQCVIVPSDGADFNHDFEISPKEFLSYSKHDFKTNDKRGNINALTNAKRAIDCQTDKIFFSIGLNPYDFPKVVEEFISQSKNSPLTKDLKVKLSFLQALKFAPAKIIANTRMLRHKLEHYYKNPSNEEVSDAIELAELFILATDSKLKHAWNFSVTDQEKDAISNGYACDSIYISFNEKEYQFVVDGNIGKAKVETILINNTDIEFYYILKIFTSFDYDEDTLDALIDLLEVVKHPIPKKHIKIL